MVTWPLKWVYGDRICIIGPQGSGKTRVLKSLIAQKSNVVVIDTKQDEKEHWDRYGRVTEKVTGLRGGRYIWKVPREFIGDPKVQSAQFERFLHSGPRVIAIDEGYSLFPTFGTRLFGTQARGKRVSFIFAVQRPANVPLYFITDANFWIIFYLANDDDRKRVQHAVGSRMNWKKVWDTLQRNEFAFYIFDARGRSGGPFRLPKP